MSEHTPAPWTRGEGDKFRTAIKKVELSGKSFIIATVPDLSVESEENAEFICRAVNSYDDLVEALRKIASMGPEQNGMAKCQEIAETALLKSEGKEAK